MRRTMVGASLLVFATCAVFAQTFTPGDSDSAPSLFTALQEQQGLKLEARKASVKTVVVDRAAKLPTEN